MSASRAFRAISLLFTACLGMAAIAACTIPLRDGEQKADIAPPAPAPADFAGARLRECRAVPPEQEDLLRECRKIWSERRRIFLKDRNEDLPNPAPRGPGESPAAFPLAPSRRQ